MRNLVLSFFLLMITSLSVQAQSADTFFHSGARSYIASELQQAISQVRQGLQQFPNDPKLNALMEKLQEEQEKQQQQQQQDQQEQQQQEQQQQDQQQQDQEQQQQDQQQGQSDSQQEAQPQDNAGQGQVPEQISKEQAEKILQALAQKEKELLKEFKKQKAQGSAKNEKDW